MSKIMEVIGKNPDFKKNTCTIKLLDTGFEQLTKKIGDDSSGNFLTATTGTILSKQLLQSLNNKQLTFLPRLNNWKNTLNSYFAQYRAKGISVSDFVYNFTSLKDYSSKYIAGVTNADYYMLTEIVSAEKEMYEFLDYWGRNHIYNMSFVLQEWSKTQKYSEAIDHLIIKAPLAFYSLYNVSNPSLMAENGMNSDGYTWVKLSNVNSLPVGDSSFSFSTRKKATGGSDTSGVYYYQYTTIRITKRATGEVVINITNTNGYSIHYTGNPSPQFVITKEQATLKTVKSWVII